MNRTAILLSLLLTLILAPPASAQSCQNRAIACGQKLTGNMADAACHFTNGGVYIPYTFPGLAGETVDIFMFTSGFRPQLALYRGSGGAPIYADDSPGTTSSWIHYVLPSNGSYYFVATGYGGGGATSGTFEVSLYCENGCDLPVITRQPTNGSVTAGGSATLSVIATGTGPLHYGWFDDTDPTNTLGTDAPTFTTPPLTHTASYHAVVSNQCGQAVSRSATVTVGSCTSPALTSQPFSVRTTFGGQATLSVTATGTEPLRYQWYIGDRGDTSRTIGSGMPELALGYVTTFGHYWVRVSNACGSVDSNEYSIDPQLSRRRPATHR